MTLRPRLLFLCHTFPYPPDGGVWIRTYHVLRLLARAFDITALCFERATSSHMQSDDGARSAHDALSRLGDVEVFPLPQRHSRLRYLWDHLRSAVLGRVYTEFVYESRAFQRRLTELLNGDAFDVVHADCLGALVRYLPACDGIPVVCVHHNVESDLLRRRAAVERSRARRAYLRYQAHLMESVEHRWCQRVALNVVVSAADCAALTKIAPNSRVVVVPNGVDLAEFGPGPAKGNGIVFVGGLHWFPNRDALDFFCAEILPRLRSRRPGISVRWIGNASAEQRRTYQDRYGVEVTGHVSDARPFMQEAACHIVPLRAGGGTRLKILNAWAMEKPVVSTSIGCEGLAAVDGQNIVIRDDAKSFADAVVSVLEDQTLARRLAERGRDTVERLYGWDVIGQQMMDTYLTLAAPRFRDTKSASALIGAESTARASATRR